MPQGRSGGSARVVRRGGDGGQECPPYGRLAAVQKPPCCHPRASGDRLRERAAVAPRLRGGDRSARRAGRRESARRWWRGRGGGRCGLSRVGPGAARSVGPAGERGGTGPGGICDREKRNVREALTKN